MTKVTLPSEFEAIPAATCQSPSVKTGRAFASLCCIRRVARFPQRKVRLVMDSSLGRQWPSQVVLKSSVTLMHLAAIKRQREVSRGILAYHRLDPRQRSVHAVSLPQADICHGRWQLADIYARTIHVLMATGTWNPSKAALGTQQLLRRLPISLTPTAAKALCVKFLAAALTCIQGCIAYQVLHQPSLCRKTRDCA